MLIREQENLAKCCKTLYLQYRLISSTNERSCSNIYLRLLSVLSSSFDNLTYAAFIFHSAKVLLRVNGIDSKSSGQLKLLHSLRVLEAVLYLVSGDEKRN